MYSSAVKPATFSAVIRAPNGGGVEVRSKLKLGNVTDVGAALAECANQTAFERMEADFKTLQTTCVSRTEFEQLQAQLATLRGEFHNYTSSNEKGACSTASSCRELLAIDGTLGSGLYTITYKGSPLEVKCDMETDGGGSVCACSFARARGDQCPYN